jgi:tetratricopeptide (TPR) repeat protein
MYEASCRATFITHQQSERLFDQRMRCLERRRNRLRVAIDALLAAETSQELVDRSIVSFKLQGLEPCADLDALAAERPLPDDEEQRERIDQIRARIDESDTLHDAGDFARGLAVAGEALADARELGYPQVLAEALASLGRQQAAAAFPRDAQATLEEAVMAAARAGDARTEAGAWTWLLFSLGQQRRVQDAFALELAARVAVERAGDEVVRGWLLNNLGALHALSGDFALALEQLRRALEVKQQVLGPEHIDVGISWLNLGTAQADASLYDEALDAFQQARSIFEATVGEQHPMTHYAISSLCWVELERGRPQAAVELCTEALARFEASPPGPFWMARVSFFLARAQWDVGARQEALDTARQARGYAAGDPNKLAEIDAWLADPGRFVAKLRARQGYHGPRDEARKHEGSPGSSRDDG